MFELAAEQGNSYAEYQLGKIYCFGQVVQQNLEIGIEWLKASANHGNEYASALLEKVQKISTGKLLPQCSDCSGDWLA